MSLGIFYPNGQVEASLMYIWDINTLAPLVWNGSLTVGSVVIGSVTQGTTPWVTSNSSQLDVALSTRTKPSDQQHVLIDNAQTLTPSAPTSFVVNNSSSSTAVASNANRKGLALTNLSNGNISFGINAVAVLNNGITLAPFGVWEMDNFTFSTTAINAISSSSACSLGIQEFV